MKKIAIGIAAIVALAGRPALAADMAIKAPPPAPAAAAYDWSGFYIGGEAGWQGSRIGLSEPPGGGPLTYEPHQDSFALGAHVGAQRQFGQLVLGVEGAFASGFGQATFGTSGVNIFFPGGTAIAHAKENDIWSVGGRAGWAIGNWMPYITGGCANGSSEFDAQTTGSGPTQTATTREGGTYIGGGVDWALMNNWIIGVEYRHYDFGNKTVIANSSNPVVTGPVIFNVSTDTVMARVSYKFNWGKY